MLSMSSSALVDVREKERKVWPWWVFGLHPWECLETKQETRGGLQKESNGYDARLETNEGGGTRVQAEAKILCNQTRHGCMSVTMLNVRLQIVIRN